MLQRLACLVWFALLGAAQEAIVPIQPGDDIQAAIDRSPEGATFSFAPGVYRLVQLVPKTGNTFLGNGAVLNGSWQLTEFEKYGRLWAVSGQSQRGTVQGHCTPDRPRCAYPEDLYFDDVPLPQASSIEETRPGQWFFDYSAGKLYLGDDPAGHKVELGVRTSAFGGSAANVTVQQFVIEKYATPGQSAAINPTSTARGWIIRNNEIRLNHAWGVRVVSAAQVIGNRIRQNGQLGIGGTGEGILVEGNEISANNYAGFEPGWEAGGAKFVGSTDLVVRNNSVFGNFGTGLWTDTDNRNTLYESNRVYDNMGPGIQHEISFEAVIVGNEVMNNGRGGSPWLWGAQIQVQNSSGVDVARNYVEVMNGVGNGIALIQQNRGAYVTRDNYVHDNTVVYRGVNGQSGAVADHNGPGLFNGNNRFDFNTYHSSEASWTHWAWQDSVRTWPAFKALGQEPNGNADGTLPSPRASDTPMGGK